MPVVSHRCWFGLLGVGCASSLSVVTELDDAPPTTDDLPDRRTEIPTPTRGAVSSSASAVSDSGAGPSDSAAVREEFDCTDIPEVPGITTNLDAPRAYNDLVFDTSGGLIGSDTDIFLRSTDAKTATPFSLYDGTVYKMGILPDGDVVAATRNSGVVRIDPVSGSWETIGPNFTGYGLAVGPDGHIYVATNYTAAATGIIRVRSDTEDHEHVIDLDFTPRAIAFGRDTSVLYIGNGDSSDGRVYRLQLDEHMNAVGEPTVVASIPDGWHDTLEVDACGNLYVGTFFGNTMYRVRPGLHTGDPPRVNVWVDWNFDGYGHGFEWGSGLGPWNTTSVYFSHPYIGSRVSEMDAGVPGQAWKGTVIGGTVL